MFVVVLTFMCKLLAKSIMLCIYSCNKLYWIHLLYTFRPHPSRCSFIPVYKQTNKNLGVLNIVRSKILCSWIFFVAQAYELVKGYLHECLNRLSCFLPILTTQSSIVLFLNKRTETGYIRRIDCLDNAHFKDLRNMHSHLLKIHSSIYHVW